MTVLEEIESILRAAKSDIDALRTSDTGVFDMVLAELAMNGLVGTIATLRAAASPKGADIEAPEEPAAPRH